MVSQIFKLIPHADFERIVKETGAECCGEGLSNWILFVSMLFSQLGRAYPLREIEGELKNCEGKLMHFGIQPPERSSLAYAICFVETWRSSLKWQRLKTYEKFADMINRL